MLEEKTISSKIVYEGPVFNVRKHHVKTPGGQTVRDVVEHNGGSIILAITDKGKILMERQFRKALERVVLELPAGKIDAGEDPLTAAVRELEEETGYRAGSVKHLLSYFPTCGYSNELLHIYLCRDLEPGKKNWDDTEFLEILEYEPDEIIDMIIKKKILDSKTIIGVMFARITGEI
ncbi:MAG TPA: NUDIX hydrolase [Mogibacterium sp.]|nr:NUDIX hydrolase [Mogibacterium sp.]